MLDAFLFEIDVITVYLVLASVMFGIGRLFAVETGSNISVCIRWLGSEIWSCAGFDYCDVGILVLSFDPCGDSIRGSGVSLNLSGNVEVCQFRVMKLCSRIAICNQLKVLFWWFPMGSKGCEVLIECELGPF
jgi:hypothetical protein